MSAASKKLKVGQPSLSTQLKQFESNLGYQLFERRKKRLIITEDGKALLKYANDFFAISTELERAIADKKLSGGRQLRLGALDSIPKVEIFDFVRFCATTLSTPVSIIEADPGVLLDMASDHELDLIMTDFPPTTLGEQRFYTKDLGSEALGVYASVHFRKLKKGFPLSLDGAPFVLPKQQGRLRHEISYFFKRHMLRPEVLVETQDTALQKLFAVHDVGIIVEPFHAVEELVAQKKLLLLGEIDQRQAYFLSCAERSSNRELIDRIMTSYDRSTT